MKSVRWKVWYGLLSATQARDDDARSALRPIQPKSTWYHPKLALPALTLALPALLLGSGAGSVKASDFETFIPPGYGEPAREGPTATNLAAVDRQAAQEPIGSYSLQLGPGTALS